jgi:hypothetical protein
MSMLGRMDELEEAMGWLTYWSHFYLFVVSFEVGLPVQDVSKVYIELPHTFSTPLLHNHSESFCLHYFEWTKSRNRQ